MENVADVLINLAVISLFVLILVVAVSAAIGTSTTKKRCSPHKWSIHPATNKLTCTECGYEAGSHENEHGEY